MSIRFLYEGVPCKSFEALVAALPDEALASPLRSTVPLIDYWRHSSSLDELWKALQVARPSSIDLAFEHATPVREGSGKASFTDLMIITESVAVAIEAKFTEPRYETVSTWLGPRPTENRLAVLSGWLQYIREATGHQLRSDEVRDIPYQVVHRTASACAVARPVHAVVYQVFSSPVPAYYERDLTRLLSLLAPSTSVSAYVHACTVSPTAAYGAVVERWQQGARGLSAEVRELLATGASLSVASSSMKRVSA